MNRRNFLKAAVTGFGTLLVSGIGVSLLNDRNTAKRFEPAPSTASAASGSGRRIVVITGSPHRNGTSALLADKFIEGAKSKGHEIFRFNAAFEDIHPCRACGNCQTNGPCILNDAVEQKLMPQLLKADTIVLVTPLYYYGMSTQLKTIIDRFYSHLRSFDNKNSLLLATAYNSSDWTFDALVEHYQTLAEYMHWRDLGMVLGYGCGYRSAIERSQFPQQAFQLGQII